MPKKIDYNNSNKKQNNISNKKSMARTSQKMKTIPKTVTPKSGSKSLKKLRTQKKRGRRPKKILEDIEEFELKSDENTSKNKKRKNANDLHSEEDNNPGEIASVICHFNPVKSNKLKLKTKADNLRSNKAESDDDNESDGMFKNDIPRDNICNKCTKHEKTIALMKNRLEKTNNGEIIDNSVNKLHKTDLTLISSISGKKITLKKTNVKCFWDSCQFTCSPFPLVESFHDSTYYVLGTLFCSINCALAHNLYSLRDSKIYQRKSLTIKLYKEMYGHATNENITISEAGPKELLEDYGGKYSIEVYRNNFKLNRKYITYMPPIKPINNIIEEHNTTNNTSDTNKKKHVLERSKPLSKKKSVMSSMNITYED